MTQITRWVLNHNPIAVLLRPFNKPLVYDNLTRVGSASPLGSLTRNCPAYGRSEHLRETVSLALSGHLTFLSPSGAWSQESLRVRILSSRSLCSTPDRLSNLGFAISSLPACAKIWRRAVIFAIPKPGKAIGEPKEPSPYISSACPLQDPWETHLRSCQSNRRLFDTGSRPLNQVTLLTQNIEDSFMAKKKGRAVFVDLTAAYTTLWGTAASRANCCDCYLTDIWSAWSWRWFVIAASPSQPETTNGAG